MVKGWKVFFSNINKAEMKTGKNIARILHLYSIGWNIGTIYISNIQIENSKMILKHINQILHSNT